MSPDALLFELLDTLAQAFPRPPDEAVVYIRPDADGRPALFDIEGTVPDDAPNRPFLGRADAEILDALHQILGDLAVVTQAEAKFSVVQGRLIARRDADDAIEIWLVEDANTGNDDDDVVRLKRRFDRSEQTWLVHTSALFSRLNATEAQEKHMRDAAEAVLEGPIAVGLDLEQGVALIRNETTDKENRMEIDLIGSYAQDRGAFLWGWANDVVAPRLKNRVDDIRRASTDVGLRALIQAELPCPLEMADRLARHAAVRLDAGAVLALPYSAERGSGVVWVATRAPLATAAV